MNKLSLEAIFPPGAEYELYTPYGNEEAAWILWEVLQAARDRLP